MVKQVIVIRKDLKCRRGKEIAQGSHASMAFITRRMVASNFGNIALSDVEKEWMLNHFTKICLIVNSEKELFDLVDSCKENGIEVQLITDNGKTEFGGVPTNTCIAIGPDYSEKIDKITSHLKLY